ncbi:MFS transporter [Amycolatopsis cihanbeyliensis]|uniref:MFS transporter n=1 Tax=Amycolatopsis cihanbeyliensis TaxID=1128664 RepID=UPI0011517782|nr:MFS transporter [Amycolatopsis cihanbeyliensis]
MRSTRTRLGQAFRDIVVPPAGAGRIAGSALADSLGSGLFMSGAVVYFSLRLELDTITIGAGFAVAGVVALLVVAPLGAVADRVGYARTLKFAHFARAAIYPLYPFAGNVIGFVAIITLVTVADRMAAPVFQAMVGATVGGERRTETMGYVRALRNAGFSLGALVTSVAVAIGTTTAYDAIPIGNAVSFALAGVLLGGIRNVRALRPDRAGRGLRRIKPRYLALSALNVIMLLHDTILLLALPLYVIRQTEIPESTLPLMFVLNTVLVVVLQRRLSRMASTLPAAARAERNAGWLLAAACGCFAVAAVLPPIAGVIALVAAVVLLSLGESLQVAGAWELSYGHAPPADRGAHLAVFSIGIGVQRSVGPALVSVIAIVGAATWIPMAALFVLAGTATRRLAGAPWPGEDHGRTEPGRADAR